MTEKEENSCILWIHTLGQNTNSLDDSGSEDESEDEFAEVHEEHKYKQLKYYLSQALLFIKDTKYETKGVILHNERGATLRAIECWCKDCNSMQRLIRWKQVFKDEMTGSEANYVVILSEGFTAHHITRARDKLILIPKCVPGSSNHKVMIERLRQASKEQLLDVKYC